jgi:hypothetical protein
MLNPQNTSADKEALQQALQNKNQGLEVIWVHIALKVAASLREEFAPLFQTEEEFQKFIQAGSCMSYAALTDAQEPHQTQDAPQAISEDPETLAQKREAARAKFRRRAITHNPKSLREWALFACTKGLNNAFEPQTRAPHRP